LTWSGERSVERDPLFSVFLCFSQPRNCQGSEAKNLGVSGCVFVSLFYVIDTGSICVLSV
jgi:hypothetical protein